MSWQRKSPRQKEQDWSNLKLRFFFGFEEKESKNECGELELVELVVLTMNVRGL